MKLYSLLCALLLTCGTMNAMSDDEYYHRSMSHRYGKWALMATVPTGAAILSRSSDALQHSLAATTCILCLSGCSHEVKARLIEIKRTTQKPIAQKMD